MQTGGGVSNLKEDEKKMLVILDNVAKDVNIFKIDCEGFIVGLDSKI